MEREAYAALYRIVYDIARTGRTKHVIHSDRLIVMTFFWAVLHDRPISWACKRSNWPRGPLHDLPSASTMSRRLRREPVLQLIKDLFEVVKRRFPQSDLCFIDAKPLPIGNASGDKQAKAGWAAGRIAKGYKLHVILDANGGVRQWAVDAMAPRESKIAPPLIKKLQGSGTLVGDNAYDTNPLYNAAGKRGWQLVAPRRRGTKMGKVKHSKWRNKAHKQMTKQQRKELYIKRAAIERFFGTLTSYGGGLAPLPAHVRTLRRVRLWVQAKLILYHLRLAKKAA